MKIIVVILALLMVLAGCSAPQLEGVEDVYAPDGELKMRNFNFDLPPDADTQVMEGETGKLYFCEGYEIMVQTFSGGNLDHTLQQISGYDSSAVTVFKTRQSGLDRYECVWVSASDHGDQVSRAVVLDDGRYHYCLSVTAAAGEAGSLQDSWQSIFASVSLTD